MRARPVAQIRVKTLPRGTAAFWSSLIATISTAIALLVCTESAVGQPRPLRIGIVFDGYRPENQAVTESLRKEIAEVMLGDIDLQIDPKQTFTGDWTLAGVRPHIDRLLNDANIDLVIGFGVFASQDLALRGPLPKPCIAPAIIDPVRQKVPIQGTVSGTHNLNYLKFPLTIERDVKFFKDMVPFRKLIMLAGRRYVEGIPALNRTPEELSAVFGVSTELVLVDSQAAQALAALPVDAEAVYLHPSLHLDSTQLVMLVQGINQRRLPSFSYYGEAEVNLGVYASLNPDILPRIIRRIALNVHRIFDGEDPANLPTDFPAGKRLFLNFNTAAAIGALPSWSTLLEAELLFLDSLGLDRPRLTMEDALQKALVANLDVVTQQHQVGAGSRDIAIARSKLFPTLSLSGTALQIDKDRALGVTSERSATVGGSLTQVVFSEATLANYSIQSSLQVAREHELEQVRLDVALDALTAYLDLLRTRKTLFILLDNLKITRRNLEIARNRDITGAGEPGEPLRWESEIASNRMDVMSAHSRMMQSSYLLSQLLHLPMEDDFVAQEIELNDRHFLTAIPAFQRALNEPFGFYKLSAFLVKVGAGNAPEIQRLDALIAAQRRSLTSYRLSHFLPVVSAFGERTETIHRGGENGNAKLPYDDTDWMIGLKFAFPIFSGFATTAATNKASEELQSLEAQRASVAEKIELAIRNQLQNVKATYFGIHQSRLAAEAAQKNYDIVADAYTQGSLPIVSLLDAQSVLLSANRQSASAYYSFLIDYVNMERVIGQFGLLMTVQQMNAFENEMIEFLSRFEVTK